MGVRQVDGEISNLGLCRVFGVKELDFITDNLIQLNCEDSR